MVVIDTFADVVVDVFADVMVVIGVEIVMAGIAVIDFENVVDVLTGVVVNTLTDVIAVVSEIGADVLADMNGNGLAAVMTSCVKPL